MYKLILILLIVLIVIYFINYKIENYDSSVSVTEEEKSIFLNLVIDIVTLNPIAWYDANSYNSTTQKMVSKVNNSLVNNSLVNTQNITKMDSPFPYIYGGINSTLTDIPWPGDSKDYTFIHLAKYNGDNRGRIWNGTMGNWLSGFWSNRVGFYHEGWLNSIDIFNYPIGINASNNGTDWLLSIDMNNFARVNRGEWQQNGPSYSPPGIGVNAGEIKELSDFAIAEFIIFNKKLTEQDYTKVENYLLRKYGLFGTTMLPTAIQTELTTLGFKQGNERNICNYGLQNPDSNNCLGINGGFIDKKSIAYDINSIDMKKDVYLKYEAPYTYIVSADNQDIRYYEGPITNYKPCEWNNYAVIPDTNKEKYKTYDKCEVDKAAAAVAAKSAICNYQSLDLDSNNCIGINGGFIDKKSIAYDINSIDMKKDVYLKYEAPYTYIVSADNQDIRYYEGPITNYKPCDWDSYAVIPDTNKEQYKIYDKCETDKVAAKSAICNYQLQNPDSNNCIVINGGFIDKKSIAYDINSIDMKKDVYLKYEEPYTYIVSADNQDLRYYEGPITNYKPCDWYTYDVIPYIIIEKYKTYDKCEVDKAAAAVAAAVAAKSAICNYQSLDLDSNNCIGMNGAFVNKKSIAYDSNNANIIKDVYLKYEEPYTYIMPYDNQDGRYYNGPISKYKPCDWNTYASIQADSEKLKYKTYNKCEEDRITAATAKAAADKAAADKAAADKAAADKAAADKAAADKAAADKAAADKAAADKAAADKAAAVKAAADKAAADKAAADKAAADKAAADKAAAVKAAADKAAAVKAAADKAAAVKAAADKAAAEAMCNYPIQNTYSNNCIVMNKAFVNKKSIAYDKNTNMIKDVYLIYEAPNTVIMSYDNQDGRYYKGPISDYKPCNWNNYTVIPPKFIKSYITYDKCEADKAATAAKK